MSRTCGRCKKIIKESDGSERRCKNKIACNEGCRSYCWLHSRRWKEGKGCTGKTLYQYRKKSGPKTGKCGPTKMIGASGKCVARTRANLEAKKRASAKKAAPKRRASAKKAAPKRRASAKRVAPKEKEEISFAPLRQALEYIFEPNVRSEDVTMEEVVEEARKNGGEKSEILKEMGVKPMEYIELKDCPAGEILDLETGKCVKYRPPLPPRRKKKTRQMDVPELRDDIFGLD